MILLRENLPYFSNFRVQQKPKANSRFKLKKANACIFVQLP